MLKALSQKLYLERQKDYDVLPSISAKEQKKLFQKMEKYPERKQEIKNEIFEKNKGLIDFWARRIKRLHPISGLDSEDIYQAGFLGLMRAIDKFKWRKGYRFSTYAISWINQSMRRTIYNQSSTLFIPVYKREMLAEYQKAKRELYQELKRHASIREIAVKMDVNTAEINHLEKIRKPPLSLEAPFSVEDGDNSLINTIVDEKTMSPIAELEKEDLKKELAGALSFLSPRARKILILRFGLKDDRKRTLNEVGKIMAVSRERIRQIQNIALRRLRWKNPQLRELLE